MWGIDIERYTNECDAVVLIGCRARGRPYDVCEYNILLYQYSSLHDHKGNCDGYGNDNGYDNGNFSDYIRLDHSDGHIIKVHRLSSNDTLKRAILLRDAVVLYDPNMLLSKSINDRMYRKRYIKKSIVKTLVHLSRCIDSDGIVASLWLKTATCYYIEAFTALNNSYIMPSHALQQLKRDNNSRELSMILDAIAVEDASRSLLSIMIDESLNLYKISNRDDPVIKSKIEYMYSNGMYTDLYLYICYLCRDLININSAQVLRKAMNLSSDTVRVKEIAYKLMDRCKDRMKYLYSVHPIH
jgi:hypothetical protein